MKSEQENFTNLRRLLALKRHEQPPPGYFNSFSRQVMDRIVSGQHLEEDSLAERMLWEAPWLQRLLSAFQTKPLLAGAFGVAVCALLVSGVVFSEKPDTSALAGAPQMPDTTLARANPQDQPSIFSGASTAEVSDKGWVPATEGSRSLFSEFQKRPIQPVSFNPGE